MLIDEEKKKLHGIRELVKSLYECSKNKLGFKKDAKIIFIVNESNAQNPLGKTAYYDPQNYKVAVYTNGRHSKDILRSLSHELVHHAQNCRGEFQNTGPTQEGYAQKDEHLRKMEKEAYLKGNMIFRDFEDGLKSE